MYPDSSGDGLFLPWTGHVSSVHAAGNDPASRQILIHPEIKGFLGSVWSIFVPSDFWFQWAASEAKDPPESLSALWKIFFVLKSPAHDGIEHRKQVPAHRREWVFHVRRNFVKLPAGDQTMGFQFAQCLCQHGVRDTGQIFFQNAEPYGVIDAEFIENLGFAAF